MTTPAVATLAERSLARAGGTRFIPGNATRLLLDGPQVYPAMLEAIASAPAGTRGLGDADVADEFERRAGIALREPDPGTAQRRRQLADGSAAGGPRQMAVGGLVVAVTNRSRGQPDMRDAVRLLAHDQMTGELARAVDVAFDGLGQKTALDHGRIAGVPLQRPAIELGCGRRIVVHAGNATSKIAAQQRVRGLRLSLGPRLHRSPTGNSKQPCRSDQHASGSRGGRRGAHRSSLLSAASVRYRRRG